MSATETLLAIGDKRANMTANSFDAVFKSIEKAILNTATDDETGDILEGRLSMPLTGRQLIEIIRAGHEEAKPIYDCLKAE